MKIDTVSASTTIDGTGIVSGPLIKEACRPLASLWIVNPKGSSPPGLSSQACHSPATPPGGSSEVSTTFAAESTAGWEIRLVQVARRTWK